MAALVTAGKVFMVAAAAVVDCSWTIRFRVLLCLSAYWVGLMCVWFLPIFIGFQHPFGWLHVTLPLCNEFKFSTKKTKKKKKELPEITFQWQNISVFVSSCMDM